MKAAAQQCSGSWATVAPRRRGREGDKLNAQAKRGTEKNIKSQPTGALHEKYERVVTGSENVGAARFFMLQDDICSRIMYNDLTNLNSAATHKWTDQESADLREKFKCIPLTPVCPSNVLRPHKKRTDRLDDEMAKSSPFPKHGA